MKKKKVKNTTKKEKIKQIKAVKKNIKKQNTKKAIVKSKNLKTKELKNKIYMISGLIIFILIILISFLFHPSVRNTVNPIVDNNTDSNVDSNINTNLANNDLNGVYFDTNMTKEEFEDAAKRLQKEINRDIILAQEDILKKHYSDLNIDVDKLNQCISENNYSRDDFNISDSNILLKIQKDISLAKILGINGTPGIYINSYYISGYKDYNSTKEVLEAAILDSENEIKINLDNNSYNFDSNSSPKLLIVYNDDYNFTRNNLDAIITNLKASSSSDFFSDIFNSVEVKKINYRDPEGISLLETLNVPAVPIFFLEGNIKDMNFYKDDNGSMFNKFFLKVPEGYLLKLPPTQNLKYELIKSDDDYIIGNKDANVSVYVFTDYQCPYCKMFEENTQRNIITDYVDSNRVNIIIKDFVVHQPTALFPAIFSRCVEEQNADYLKVHELLFSLQHELGSNGSVKEVMDSYRSKIDNLNKVYKKLYNIDR